MHLARAVAILAPLHVNRPGPAAGLNAARAATVAAFDENIGIAADRLEIRTSIVGEIADGNVADAACTTDSSSSGRMNLLSRMVTCRAIFGPVET